MSSSKVSNCTACSPLQVWGFADANTYNHMTFADPQGQKFRLTMQFELEKVNMFYVDQEQQLEVSFAHDHKSQQRFASDLTGSAAGSICCRSERHRQVFWSAAH